MKQAILGAIIALLALWVGAYTMGQIPNNHWAALPTIVTTGCFILGGFALVVSGVNLYLTSIFEDEGN